VARHRPIALVGCGAVGRALAMGLAASGEDLLLWSRTPARARRLARSIGARARVAVDLGTVGAEARVGLLCVPEAAQPALARELARSGLPLLLTVSGGLPLASLARVARGSAVGRLHPLVPVLARAEPDCFQDMPFGLEGGPVVRRVARQLCRRLGGFELALNGRHTERYHAGAALLGGGLIALLSLAEEAQASALRDPRPLRRALVAFAARNLAHYEAHGAVAALTGPIARGAEASVRAHLDALARLPDARAAYRVLGRTMAELAGQRRGGDPASLRRLRRLLAE